MSLRTAFAALSLVLISFVALPAQAQHGRHHRRHHRPAPRKVIVVEPGRPHRR